MSAIKKNRALQEINPQEAGSVNPLIDIEDVTNTELPHKTHSSNVQIEAASNKEGITSTTTSLLQEAASNKEGIFFNVNKPLPLTFIAYSIYIFHQLWIPGTGHTKKQDFLQKQLEQQDQLHDTQNLSQQFTSPKQAPQATDELVGAASNNKHQAASGEKEDTPTIPTILTRSQYEIDNERIDLRLTSISGSDIDYVYSVLRQPSDDLLTEKFGCRIFWNKIKCFRNTNCYPNQRNESFWLNDEVINFYMGLLQDLDKQLCKDDKRRLPSYFFTIFFMSKLLEGNEYKYINVKRC